MNVIPQLSLPKWGRYKPVVVNSNVKTEYDEKYETTITGQIKKVIRVINENDNTELAYCRLYDTRIRDYMPAIVARAYPGTKWQYVQKKLKEDYGLKTIDTNTKGIDNSPVPEYLVYVSPFDDWEKDNPTWKELASKKTIDTFDEYSVYPKWNGRKPTLSIPDITSYDKHFKNNLTALIESKFGYDVKSRYCRLYDSDENYIAGIIIAKEDDEDWYGILEELKEKYHVTSAEIESQGAKFIYASPFYEWEDPEFWLTIREEVENL